jgi:hypothetical protein
MRTSINSDSPAASPTLRRSALGTAVGLVRIGAGIALAGSPRSFLRWENVDAPGSSMTLLMRTVGIRDLAVGLGTVLAARSGSPEDLRRWIGAGLLSDALDVVAGLAGSTTVGTRGFVSAAIAAPMVALDLAALNEIRSAVRGGQ